MAVTKETNERGYKNHEDTPRSCRSRSGRLLASRCS